MVGNLDYEVPKGLHYEVASLISMASIHPDSNLWVKYSLGMRQMPQEVVFRII